MSGEALIDALALPASSRIDKRVPRKLLLENGAVTAADKRLIAENIQELNWVAALKPTTIGVPEFRDEVRDYLEIAVLHVILRTKTGMTRVVELIHRAVPYPLLLLSEQGEWLGLSAVHKRWSQGEAGKTVLDGEVVAAEWESERGSEQGFEQGPDFRAALALSEQPRQTLHSLYQGLIDSITAVQAAHVTGTFTVAANAEHAGIRREALRECSRLETEIARLRAAAAKEKQMSRRVELNLELKRLQLAQAAARARL